MTIVETMAAVTLVTVLMGATYMVLLQSEKLFTAVTRQFTQQETGHRILDRLTEELRAAQPSSMLPLIVSSSSYVQFNKVTGFSGGVATVGVPITLAWQLSSGETLDGMDNDSDGFTDEGVVTYREQAGPTIILADDVLSLQFSSTATGISFTVALGALNDQNGVVSKTYSKSIDFRNTN
jgi:hypothetical protein